MLRWCAFLWAWCAGAGDSFIGALAVFLSEGAAMKEAMHRACAVAALSVTRRGTQTSYPTRSELGL